MPLPPLDPLRRAGLGWGLAWLAAALHAQPVLATLRVELDLRAEIAAGRFDPARDGVGLRGAAPLLSWQQSLALAPGPKPGWYFVTLRGAPMAAAHQGLAYKFKLERAGADANEGWETGRNHLLRLQAGEQTLRRAFGAEPAPLVAQRSGRIERIAMPAAGGISAREVQVWLPPGYADAGAVRHPVLYLQDGQNVFDAVAAGTEWQVDETAQRLVRAGAITPPIVVAVASNDERITDYTAVPEPGRGGGGAARYAAWLLQVLKPEIDRRYRTRPEREHTAVGGSSLGGLLALQMVLEHAEQVGAALVVSPSVWWANETVLAQVRRAPATLPVPRLWLQVGEAEGATMLQGARALRGALQRRGWVPAYRELPGAGHDEASWALGVEDMLRFLYAPAASSRP